MERVDVKTMLLAALFTVILFLGVYGLSTFIGERREQVVTEKMNEIIEDFEEIETTVRLIELLSEKNNTCNILTQELEYLESKLWKLDGRITEYREITKDFASDEFYIREKKRLNRREIIYMAMLEKVKKMCDYEQMLILYFYGECEKNRECDEQGFVLSYINQRADPEIAILSFDADRNVQSVNSLISLYNITEYPCVVVDEHTHCGLHDKGDMEEILCMYSNLSICT
ncbi:MAG: hypothetical protein JW778_05905 [Candidatus Altiarchaeota archaeon]|nr:hypothetical protein [Candidatus Altiarchaeota archaeon]